MLNLEIAKQIGEPISPQLPVPVEISAIADTFTAEVGEKVWRYTAFDSALDICLQVDANGAVYVNQYQSAVSIQCAQGDMQGGVDIVTAGAGGVKHRVYKIIVNDAAAEVHTITDMDIDVIYTSAGGVTVIDFGPAGMKQTTAATAITITSADASATQVTVIYSLDA